MARLVRQIGLLLAAAGAGIVGAVLLAGPVAAHDGGRPPAAAGPDGASRRVGPLAGVLDGILSARADHARPAGPAEPGRGEPGRGHSDGGRPGVSRPDRLVDRPTSPLPLSPAAPPPAEPDAPGPVRPARPDAGPGSGKPSLPDARPGSGAASPGGVGSLTTALAGLVTDAVTGAAQQVLPPALELVDELLTPLLPALPALPADPAGPPGPATPPAGPAPPGGPVEPGAPGFGVPASVPGVPAPLPSGRVGGMSSGAAVASPTGWTAGPGAARAASGQVGTAAEAQPSGGPGRSVPPTERADDGRTGSGPAPASTDDTRWPSYVAGRERTTRSSVPVDDRVPAVTVRPG
ncbi:hypothetical protein [Micromonospora rubida]|uniref:hypothetical protein n=1 Tax=Micromonospora rubida TaxID=2697657 RepID=UPI001378F0C9|nr:hypothetical protein [Micromonospora rubida]NBE79842.1 hypothetical protein [Micromonospora rubida]